VPTAASPTATFTPTSNITDTTNLITPGQHRLSRHRGNAGSGTTDSNNYAIDTQRPTATIVVADPALRSRIAGDHHLQRSGDRLHQRRPDGKPRHLSSGEQQRRRHHLDGDLHARTNTNSASNLITLANTGIADLAGNAGAGTTNSAITPSTRCCRRRPSWWPTRR
jgi:hypothetical protein